MNKNNHIFKLKYLIQMNLLDEYVLRDVITYFNNDDKLIVTLLNKKFRDLVGDILWYCDGYYQTLEPNNFDWFREDLCHTNYSVRLFNQLDPKSHTSVFRKACFSGNTEMVQKILPLIKCTKESEIKYKDALMINNVCLIFASERQHIDVVNLLLSKFEYDQKTILHAKCRVNDIEYLENELKKIPQEKHDKIMDDIYTSMCIANNVKMVEYLIEKHGVTDYDMGLIRASNFCNAEVAELLIKKGATCYDIALGCACEHWCGKPRIYQVLTMSGATRCDWCHAPSENHIQKDDE